jgi:uncharacterized membrane protein
MRNVHEVGIAPEREVPQNSRIDWGIPEMRILALGHVLFAIGLAGLGVLSIGSGDFAYTWQPVPEFVPARATLAVVSGLLLIGAGLGLLQKRWARTSALIMTIYLATWVLALQSPKVAHAPMNVGAWLGFCENLILVCGGWTLFLSLDRSRTSFLPLFMVDPAVPRILFGASCIVLGVSHFVYADATAGMVPAWLPNHVFFAYLTGSGHLAAGLAILFGVVPRLAATLEAGMISIFVLLIHLPGVFSSPANRLQWTMLFVASALAGASWVVAGLLHASSWGWARKAPARTQETLNAESGN